MQDHVDKGFVNTKFFGRNCFNYYIITINKNIFVKF